MKLIEGYLSWMIMHYSGLLRVLGCLGTALMELLGVEVDFDVVSGLEMGLGRVDFGTREC